MKNIYCKNKCFFVSVYLYVFLFSTNIFSQADTLYFNTDGVKMSKEDFKVNIEKDFYSGNMYATDSLVEIKLRLNYSFGNLSDVTKSQLYRLLSKRLKVDTTKILSCFYLDTLGNKNQFPLKNYAYLIGNKGDTLKKRPFKNTKFINYILKKWSGGRGKFRFSLNFETFFKLYKNKIRAHKEFRENVEPLMVYGYNNSESDEIEGVTWCQDYGGVIKKLFNYRDEIIQYVLIRPNGEFYAQYSFVGTPYFYLFNDKDWNFHRDNFLKER